MFAKSVNSWSLCITVYGIRVIPNLSGLVVENKVLFVNKLIAKIRIILTAAIQIITDV
jgi:hypothetical protein